MEPLDFLQDVATKFHAMNMCERYNPEITSKKYYTMRIVYTSAIDIMRKQSRKPYILSMDKDLAEDFTLHECLSSSSLMNSVNYDLLIEEIVKELPDVSDSKIEGNVPGLGIVNLTPRVLARLVLKEARPLDVCKWFHNPASGRHITASRISQLMKQAKESLITICQAKYNI